MIEVIHTWDFREGNQHLEAMEEGDIFLKVAFKGVTIARIIINIKFTDEVEKRSKEEGDRIVRALCKAFGIEFRESDVVMSFWEVLKGGMSQEIKNPNA